MNCSLKLSALLLAVSLLVPSLPARAADVVAVVDTATLATQSTPGKAAAEYLKKVQATLQKGMDDLQTLYKGKENTDEGRAALLQGKATLDQQLDIYRQAVAMQLNQAMGDAVKTWRGKNSKTLVVVPAQGTMDYASSADVTKEVLPLLNKISIKFPDMPQVTVNKPDAAKPEKK